MDKNNSVIKKLWNASPKSVAILLFPRYFANRIVFKPFKTLEFADPDETERLMGLPRYFPTTTNFMGRTLNLVDAASYLYMCDEIFLKKNYEFEASRKDPFIIDCGANIGLSVIFFKKLYPDSKIIAFEPDYNVFQALKKNVESFELRDVELHNKAVWFEETELTFYSEGSWGGKVASTSSADDKKFKKVKSVRLRDFLNKHVDFLKIDIEGAESSVLKDCALSLDEVEHMFFEYHSITGEKQVLHELLELLQKAGYRYHIKEASTRKMPFIEKPTTDMDLQLDVFAYRK